MPSLQYLQFLHLSKCSLNDEKIDALLGNVKLINVNELILGKNNKISSTGWKYINLAIENSVCLNRLDLLDCSIDDEKLEALFNKSTFN